MTEPTVPRAAAVAAGLKAGTMLDAPQLDWLYYLARTAPDGPAVEVGVWKGGSILCWARARRERGTLHAVDTWYGQPMSATRRKFLRNVEKSGLPIALIEQPGHEAAAQFEDGTVAFVFIDACHDDKADEGIGLDLAAWAPKVAPNGILVLHDYGTWKCPAVKTIADAWYMGSDWELMGLVGSAAAYRRPAEDRTQAGLRRRGAEAWR